MFLRHRSEALELMDEPHRVRRADMVGALEGLERVNAWLGGRTLTAQYVLPVARRLVRNGAKLVRLCDVGTGSADIPRYLVRLARRERLPLQITAVEFNEDLAESARRACRSFPEIQVVSGDAREVLRAAAQGDDSQTTKGQDIIARPSRFDLVTACLFTHHFPPQEVVAWLSLFHGAARAGFIVNDLERHPLAWVGIKLVGPLMCRNRVFLHDGPLSVRRAYTPGEWERMAAIARVPGATIHRHWPWRLIISTVRR